VTSVCNVALASGNRGTVSGARTSFRARVDHSDPSPPRARQMRWLPWALALVAPALAQTPTSTLAASSSSVDSTAFASAFGSSRYGLWSAHAVGLVADGPDLLALRSARRPCMFLPASDRRPAGDGSESAWNADHVGRGGLRADAASPVYLIGPHLWHRCCAVQGRWVVTDLSCPKPRLPARTS